MIDVLLKRIEALELEIRNLKNNASSSRSTQNPFWFGILIKTLDPATNPLDGHTTGEAELLIPDRTGNPDDLVASGKVLPLINRFIPISASRGTLMLFARDWNKSTIIMPSCEADHEDLLTVDEAGEPLVPEEEPP